MREKMNLFDDFIVSPTEPSSTFVISEEDFKNIVLRMKADSSKVGWYRLVGFKESSWKESLEIGVHVLVLGSSMKTLITMDSLKDAMERYRREKKAVTEIDENNIGIISFTLLQYHLFKSKSIPREFNYGLYLRTFLEIEVEQSANVSASFVLPGNKIEEPKNKVDKVEEQKNKVDKVEEQKDKIDKIKIPASNVRTIGSKFTIEEEIRVLFYALLGENLPFYYIENVNDRMYANWKSVLYEGVVVLDSSSGKFYTVLTYDSLERFWKDERKSYPSNFVLDDKEADIIMVHFLDNISKKNRY